jgi:hypothetical protein
VWCGVVWFGAFDYVIRSADADDGVARSALTESPALLMQRQLQMDVWVSKTHKPTEKNTFLKL